MYRSLLACVASLAFGALAVAADVPAGSENRAGSAIIEDASVAKEPGLPEQGRTHWYIVGSIGLTALAMIATWLVMLRRSTANPGIPKTLAADETQAKDE